MFVAALSKLVEVLRRVQYQPDCSNGIATTRAHAFRLVQNDQVWLFIGQDNRVKASAALPSFVSFLT